MQTLVESRNKWEIYNFAWHIGDAYNVYEVNYYKNKQVVEAKLETIMEMIVKANLERKLLNVINVIKGTF